MSTEAKLDHRRPYFRFVFLGLLFSWVAYYQCGPARIQFLIGWTHYSTAHKAWAYLAIIAMVDVVVPLFAIVFGFIVVFLRYRDLKAWLLLGLLFSFSVAIQPTRPDTPPG